MVGVTLLNDHATEILGLIAGNTNITAVFDGAVPNPRPALPWVVVYLHMESPKGAIGTTLAGESSTLVIRAICHCAGATAAAARVVADQVRTALIDITPTVSGRACDMVCQESSDPPVRDETTGSLVMDQIDVYRFNSYPA